MPYALDQTRATNADRMWQLIQNHHLPPLLNCRIRFISAARQIQPATCALHLTHLLPHLTSRKMHATALHCNHTPLWQDMTCTVRILHNRCRIRARDAEKVWVDVAESGRRTFPRRPPTCRSPVVCGRCKSPLRDLLANHNPQSW